MSFGAKFIETSVGIQHNVDELLVGALKQIRLREEDSRRKAGAGSSAQAHTTSKKGESNGGGGKGLSSPLHTLQVARDILAKVCLNASHGSISKSCENLHVL